METLRFRNGLNTETRKKENKMRIFNEDIDVAVERGHTEEVIELIENGINPNLADGRGRTPLHKAAFWGHAKTAKALIQHGANANARNELRETPLHIAAEYDQVETVEVLLDLKPNIIDKKDLCGNTALHWATMNDCPETVKETSLEKKSVFGFLSSVITPNVLPAPSASFPVMIGV